MGPYGSHDLGTQGLQGPGTQGLQGPKKLGLQCPGTPVLQGPRTPALQGPGSWVLGPGSPINFGTPSSLHVVSLEAPPRRLSRSR